MTNSRRSTAKTPSGDSWQRLEFVRPDIGPDIEVKGAPDWARAGVPWKSNGGGPRRHPDRALPFSLSCALPPGVPVTKVALLGVFANHAQREHEAPGTVGAAIGVLADGRQIWRCDLVNGAHYRDSVILDLGDREARGATIESVGALEIDGVSHRLDLITFSLPNALSGETLIFRDLGSPASFWIFDIGIRLGSVGGCPFHSGKAPGVSLSELPGIVRVGDRVRLGKAVELLKRAVLEEPDLEDAKGEALTFLAVITAASLELGGGREMHRIQLHAARQLDALETREEVAEATQGWIDQVMSPLFSTPENPSAAIINRALAILDRNFAKDISDEEIASNLGLSTSHFRFLFKQATGQPFHKYLIALRLEKARKMLVETSESVSAVAVAVGFTSLSHFSRAFAQRFSVSPVNLRRAGSGNGAS